MRKKRILSLILALLMLVIATACGGASKPAASSGAESGTSAAESTVSKESRSDKEPGKTEPKDAAGAVSDSKSTAKTEASDSSAGGKRAEETSSAVESIGASDAGTGASQESTEGSESASSGVKEEQQNGLDRNGSYTSKEDVALYIHLYGELPSNFITKKEARALGWSGGSLEPYAPGKCIGGDRFGNHEGNLPNVRGRTYYECDIDTLGKKKRGAKRIIYSTDGQIYYTEDHYSTFELLYGEE